MADSTPTPINFLSFIPHTNWGAIIAGTSTFDISAAVSEANSIGASVTLPPGQYTVATTCTFNVAVQMQAGAYFNVATGVTLTLGARFDADPSQQCFKNATAGLGTIAFNFAANTDGYPEWWGAITNNGSFDNTAAFQACHKSAAVMRLKNDDYFFSHTVTFATSYRTIQGVQGVFIGRGTGTRLIFTTTACKTQTQAYIGIYPVPSAASSCASELFINDVCFVRDSGAYPITPNSSSDTYNAVVGLQIGGLSQSAIRRCWVKESPVGFRVNGIIHSFIDDCIVERDYAGDGTNPSNDFFIGFFFGGAAANMGFAGANASLYCHRCSVGGLSTLTASTGMLLRGYFCDTFVRDFEMSQLQYGIRINGDSIGVNTAHQDVSIDHPVCDQCSQACIQVSSTNNYGTIEISNPYAAPASGGTAYQISQSASMLTIYGGIGLGTTNTTGLSISSSNAWDVNGLKLRDFSTPVSINTANAFNLRPIINNLSVTATAAISTSNNVSRGTISPIVTGNASMFTYGINLGGTGANFMECNLTGINQGAFVTVSAANKLFYNGATVSTATAPSYPIFGTGNLLSGVAG